MTINLAAYMEGDALAPQLPEPEARLFATSLHDLTGMKICARSITSIRGSLFFLGREGSKKRLGIISNDSSLLANFKGNVTPVTIAGSDKTLLICPPLSENADRLRSILPFLAPRTLGLKRSAGCGDRLGLATPGHVRAIERSYFSPIFAQQSMRENSRTGRTPQEVIDDSVWGVFQEGWRYGYGADADHLKTAADIDLCARSGYTFYTFDPGDHVDNQADTDTPDEILRKAGALPWDLLESSADDLCRRLADRPLDLESLRLVISREELLTAAAKYGKAVAHTVAMYRHLDRVMGGRAFEVEMSVDETASVTSLAEHVYVASELKRLGVKWVSLAPRYVGTFEKGVDYIGDLAGFEKAFAGHAAVAQALGPYKLSLHSGSDKFSIYPIVARLAGELVHLKTAGTSYLEAVRAIAQLDPQLFRKILALGLERYSYDRASYHVSADARRVPDAFALSDQLLPLLLEDFNAREVLHVTFGSVIQTAELREQLFDVLRHNEETYYRLIEHHFRRHFDPFDH